MAVTRSPDEAPPDTESATQTAFGGTRLKLAGYARCPFMRVFSLAKEHLLLLDNALHGRLSHALTEVAREGGDPVLTVERVHPPEGSPSSWYLHVTGSSQPRRFEITDLRVFGVVAHVHLVDYVEDLKADLRLRVTSDQTAEQLAFDFDHQWSHRHPGDPS